MALQLYTVLPASDGWVNGVEVTIGTEVPLTPAEARYEVDLGNVAPTGREPPVSPLPPTLLPSDLLETRRGGLDRDVVLAALDAYLIRDGGALLTLLGAREADLAARLTAQGVSLDVLRATILGGAASDVDTLAKLAAAIRTTDAAAKAAAATASAAAAEALALTRSVQAGLDALNNRLTGTF